VKPSSAPAIALLLAGGMCLLPFLVPYHQQPVLSFFPEWLAAALGIAAALVALAGRGFRAEAALPVPAPWFVAFALFLALRAAAGGLAYPQVSLLAALYVLFAVLMIQLGAQLVAAHGVERVVVVLAGFLLFGALANSAAGVIQFYGRPVLFEDIIAELRGERAYGNIAQTNLYANYVALGAAALLFLWLRARVRNAIAIAALGLLVVASALSGSRSALLYALWFALLGLLATRVPAPADARRLAWGAYGLAAAFALAHVAVPWVNGMFHLGLAQGALERLAASTAEYGEPRLAIFSAALRVFAAAPLVGAGSGEFAGAAFTLGLDPALTRIAQVWTSPHSLPLQLLAEAGAIGAVLVLGGLGHWGLQLVRSYRAEPSPALWWIAAAMGVELLHSLVEFPLWNAHFLGVTALLLGASTTPQRRSPAIARSARGAGFAAVAATAVTLALLLRDYVLLDTARVTGTAPTLAPAAQVQRDAGIMRELRHGLLAPQAELWIVIGAPLDRGGLADKLAMSERVARFWPANVVVVRRAVFLALGGRSHEARALLADALRTFPQARGASIALLEQALAADPAAVGPLLAMARAGAATAPDYVPKQASGEGG
jgi:O-antigen ligase